MTRNWTQPPPADYQDCDGWGQDQCQPISPPRLLQWWDKRRPDMKRIIQLCNDCEGNLRTGTTHVVRVYKR